MDPLQHHRQVEGPSRGHVPDEAGEVGEGLLAPLATLRHTALIKPPGLLTRVIVHRRFGLFCKKKKKQQTVMAPMGVARTKRKKRHNAGEEYALRWFRTERGGGQGRQPTTNIQYVRLYGCIVP